MVEALRCPKLKILRRTCTHPRYPGDRAPELLTPIRRAGRKIAMVEGVAPSRLSPPDFAFWKQGVPATSKAIPIFGILGPILAADPPGHLLPLMGPPVLLFWLGSSRDALPQLIGLMVLQHHPPAHFPAAF